MGGYGDQVVGFECFQSFQSARMREVSERGELSSGESAIWIAKEDPENGRLGRGCDQILDVVPEFHGNGC